MKSYAKLFATMAFLAMFGGIASLRAADLQQRTAEIRTTDTVIRFAVERTPPTIVGFERTGLPNWVTQSPESVLPTDIDIEGRLQRIEWSFARMSKDEHSIAFHYTSDALQLTASSTWSAVDGPGPVEHDVTLSNESDRVVVFHFPPTITLKLRPQVDHRIEHWWVDKGAGNASDTRGTFTQEVIPRYHKVQQSGPYGTDMQDRDAIPWLAIHDVQGKHGIYGGIEFSGWTEIGVSRSSSDEVSLTMGMQVRPNMGKTRLKPGEAYHYPTCFVGAYQGDVDDGCNRLHRWVETHLRPALPWGLTPLLVNNSWGSGMAVDETLARKMIDDCAELGMELFQLDAGWYEDVGHWHANPEKFPNGIANVVDYAHSKGLKFGMWIAWTQGGSLKTSDPNVLSVYNQSQQDWFGRDMPADWKNYEFIGEPVCLGSPDAGSWCLRELRRMVKDYRLDLVEHDQDMMLDECGRDGHDHLPNDPVDVSRATAEAYYDIYDQLRKENPHLLFEDCVNGGRLVDFGVAKRVHYICATDTYNPLTCRQAFFDASYPLPPSMVEVYLENVPTETPAGFASMLRSAMMGWATIMIDTSKWTPEQRRIAKREFTTYKERLRPLIAAANLYHILPRPTGNHWDGVQYHDPVTGTGAVYVFRAQATDESQTIKLKGLDPAQRYTTESIDGSTATGAQTGKVLMENGLTVSIHEANGSELIFLSVVR